MIDIQRVPIDVKLTIVRGDDWLDEFRFGQKDDPDAPVVWRDLTGWGLSAQVRATPESPAVLGDMVVTALANQTDPTVTGRFTVHLSDVVAATLPASATSDVEFVDPGGLIRTHFRIVITVIPDTTRAVVL